MAKHIYYDKTLIGAIENERIVFDSPAIEKSGMPTSLISHIKCRLLNALPEGIRFESLVVLASKNGNNPNYKIELVPLLDDLPGHFSIGESTVPPNGEHIRRYVPLPDYLPISEVQSNLSAAFLRPQSEIRCNMKPSFSGYQDKFVANLSIESGQLTLSIPKPEERGNVSWYLFFPLMKCANLPKE